MISLRLVVMSFVFVLAVGQALPCGAGVPEADVREAKKWVLNHWASKSLPDWQSHGKVVAPRIVLAKLITRNDVQRVNMYLRQATPWSTPGSSWGWPKGGAGHKGDYDFTVVTLVEILYRFGDRPRILQPKTRRHLLDTLLTVRGGTPRETVPGSNGIVEETENHLLMTEGSRYLINQWLHRHGTEAERQASRFNNAENGLRQWLRAKLKTLRQNGFYEFNSIPYEGYAIQALANLASYARPPELAKAAKKLLDGLFWRVALGSLELRRSVPFRRQFDRTLNDRLDRHSALSYLRVWCGDPNDRLRPKTPDPPRLHEAIIAASIPYTPPDEVLTAALRRGDWNNRSWFMRVGHGSGASPSIFSAGPGYLISAGGTARPGIHPVRVRPTVLLLQGDRAWNMQKCFHIPGSDSMVTRNNTGVHRNVAVGNSPVAIPKSMDPVVTNGHWRVFQHGDSPRAVWIAVCNMPDHPEGPFGLFTVQPSILEDSPADWLHRLRRANPDPNALRRRFVRPGGRQLRYDMDAPPDEWVIQSVKGRTTQSSLDQWPVWSKHWPTVLRNLRGQ